MNDKELIWASQQLDAKLKTGLCHLPSLEARREADKFALSASQKWADNSLAYTTSEFRKKITGRLTK